MTLEIVDAHHHFWNLDKNYYPWLVDREEKHFFLGDYSSLKRNYLPDEYKQDARDFKIIATVHVEAEWDRDDQVGETAWLHQIFRDNGMPNAVVGHVWLASKDCEEILNKHQQFKLFRGVRSKPITSLNPDHATPNGAGSMHDPNWRHGLSVLERLGLSYDLRVPYWHLHEAADVLGVHSNLQVALNHTGFPWDRSKKGIKLWKNAMRAIAACPNVCVKLSEFGLKNAPWTIESNRGVVLDTIEIFGIERCMWASNFPVAGLKISYKDQLDGMLEIMRELRSSDLQKIFSENAIRFYKISLPQQNPVS